MVDDSPAAGAAGWRAVGATTVGATHVRAGVPNQDALYLPGTSALPLVVAVSDGHGSAKCFRSDKGSRLAVGTAAVVVRELLGQTRDERDVAKVEARAREWLPGEIARRWREAVKLDLTLSPFGDEELGHLEKKDGRGARQLVCGNPLLAYGATVLVLAVDERMVIFVQLGDGDFLVVSESGEVTRPLAGDERLFAGETTSLATPSAARDFRVAVQALEGPGPALVLLSTDGYANSFRDDEGFLKVGADILQLIAAEGLEKVAADIPSWIEETSRMGSGDDVTLAVVCRTDAIRPAAPAEVVEKPAAPAVEESPPAPGDDQTAPEQEPTA